MDVTEQRAAMEAVAARFADVAPSGWVRLVGSWEATLKPDGEVNLNYLTMAVVAGEDRWLYGQVGFDEPLYDLVVKLNEGMAAAGSRWTVFDLEVDADGTFRTSYGYDLPKRSNGIMDEESMGRFETYLDGWVAQHGPVPGR